VEARFDCVRFQLNRGGSSSRIPWQTLEDLERDREFIKAVNKSGFLPDEEYARLAGIRTKRYRNAFDVEEPLLTDDEWEALSVRRGNLTEKERSIMNSHSVSTKRILSKIPWTPELEGIPDIASHHHEKNDGSGYPDGLAAPDICLEDRILAVVDMYDAIIAQDRPYKPAMPPEKALEILSNEANGGRLDADVVEFFIEKGVYKIFL
jgi:hypothetical protein